MKRNSKLFSLNIADISRGLLIAVLTPVFTTVLQSLNSGSIVLNFKSIGVSALAGGMAYILKNFLSNSSGQILGSEKK